LWIWASWAWPIPALILGAGWSRLGRDAFEAALLVTSAPSAFMRVVLPSLTRHAFIALLILFVIFLGEYSVPHAQGVFVIASDLLDTVSYGERGAAVLAVVRGTVPSLAVIFVLAWLLKRWRRGVLSDVEHGGRIESARPPLLLTVLVLTIVGVTTVLPLAVILWRVTLISDLAEALRTYSPELFGTLSICLAVGVVTTLVGLSIANARRIRGLAVALTIACGVVPGAAVGQAVLAAYQPSTSIHSLPFLADLSGWIYDHWPIVVIGLSARFAWLGALVGWLARASIPLPLLEQARVDGLSGRSEEIGLQVGYQWPALLSGIFLGAAMSMAELSVVSIVRVPYPNMVAMILIEKFHRFETGMLSALSLLLVASVLPGAILMFVALRRRDRSCEL
jgi:ABC-type Fe3+ transport system permease subunit